MYLIFGFDVCQLQKNFSGEDIKYLQVRCYFKMPQFFIDFIVS
jgi:hypothetical protein